MTLTKVPSLHLHLTFFLFSARLRDLGRSSRSSYATVVSMSGFHILMGDVKVSHNHHFSSPAHGGKWPSRTVGTSEIELT